MVSKAAIFEFSWAVVDLGQDSSPPPAGVSSVFLGFLQQRCFVIYLGAHASVLNECYDFSSARTSFKLLWTLAEFVYLLSQLSAQPLINSEVPLLNTTASFVNGISRTLHIFPGKNVCRGYVSRRSSFPPYRSPILSVDSGRNWSCHVSRRERHA